MVKVKGAVWWIPTFQELLNNLYLDIDSQYTLEAAREGEHITVQPEPEIPAFGDAEQAFQLRCR